MRPSPPTDWRPRRSRKSWITSDTLSSEGDPTTRGQKSQVPEVRLTSAARQQIQLLLARWALRQLLVQGHHRKRSEPCDREEAPHERFKKTA